MTHPGHAFDANLAVRDPDLIRHNALVSLRWFGQNVRRLRMELGIPQRQLAHVVGCHPSAIGQLERKGRPMRFAWMLAIADALDTTIGALLDE